MKINRDTCEKRFYRWGVPRPDRRAKEMKGWGTPTLSSNLAACAEWPEEVKREYDVEDTLDRLTSAFPRLHDEGTIRLTAELRLRREFENLAEQWLRETRHLSVVAKKVTHPAYLRIIGMGKPALPLILDMLQRRPAHWFTALRAIANIDFPGHDVTPSMYREQWLEWGRKRGYID